MSIADISLIRGIALGIEFYPADDDDDYPAVMLDLLFIRVIIELDFGF